MAIDKGSWFSWEKKLISRKYATGCTLLYGTSLKKMIMTSNVKDRLPLQD